MNAVLVKTLRRLGIGSLTGIALYLIPSAIALALVGVYTSQFTIGDDWAWSTLGNVSAWFVLGYPAELEAIDPVYNIAGVILPIIIGLLVAAWEIIYILKSENINWVLAFTVAIFGVFAVIMSQLIWTVL